MRWKEFCVRDTCERKRERGSIQLKPSKCFKLHILYCKYHILPVKYVSPLYGEARHEANRNKSEPTHVVIQLSRAEQRRRGAQRPYGEARDSREARCECLHAWQTRCMFFMSSVAARVRVNNASYMGPPINTPPRERPPVSCVLHGHCPVALSAHIFTTSPPPPPAVALNVTPSSSASSPPAPDLLPKHRRQGRQEQ